MIALLLACCSPAWADEPTRVDGYAEALDRGWLEAVITVRHPQAVLQLAEQVAGWRVEPMPTADGVTASAAGGFAPAREWRVGDASGQPGVLRLIQADAASARSRAAGSSAAGSPAAGLSVAGAVRASAQPWDTGGHFSVMTRSNDAEGRWRAAEALGWGAWNAPVELDFAGVRLVNVILRGPEGVNVSIYERRAPRMPDAPDLRGLRRPFNAMQIVRDAAAARRFYVDILKFEVLAEGRYRGAPGVVNNFGMPAKLTGQVTLEYMILAPVKAGPTHIEVVHADAVPLTAVAPRRFGPDLASGATARVSLPPEPLKVPVHQEED
jgi:hypothetical protein